MAFRNNSGSDTRSWKEQLEDAYRRAEERRKAGKLPQIGQSHSAFWMGADTYSTVYSKQKDPLARTSPEFAMKLSGIRRGIANFVRIVTGRDIPVHFSTGEQSFAVGKENKEMIVISATDDPAQFDVNVGTALHEAAHLILSRRSKEIPESMPLFEWVEVFGKNARYFFTDVISTEGERLNMNDGEITKLIKTVVNFMEDRRIDKWMYERAVGYRGYYEAMYAALWQSERIDLMMQNDLSKRPLVKMYVFHIVNMTNAYANPDALPGLAEIWRLINLPVIERFSDDVTWDSWRQKQHWNGKRNIYPFNSLPEMIQVALQVTELILKNAKKPEDIDLSKFTPPTQSDDQGAASPQGSQTEDSTGGDKAGKEGDDKEPQNWDVPDLSDDETAPTEPSDSKDAEKSDEDEGEQSPSAQPATTEDTKEDEQEEGQPNAACNTPEDDERKEDAEFFDKALDEELDDQNKFLEGELEKDKIDDQTSKQLDALEGANAELKVVGNDVMGHARVIVYRKLTEALLHSPNFLFTLTFGGRAVRDDVLEDAINEGISMGNVLAHKLRIMADESTIHYNRQNSGKIDKRLLAGLGYENENVFYHSVTERFNPVLLHLTVDSSGSMAQRGGKKWHRAIKLAVAFAKAAEKVPNLDVIISFRASGLDNLAYVLIAYDSRVDSFVKIKRFFPYLRADGGTPEGLCFQAIMGEITKEVKSGMRKFFVNLSDGEPYFVFNTPVKVAKDGEVQVRAHHYHDEPAWKHTAQQVNEIRSSGTMVLSYFVTDEKPPKNGDFFYDPTQRLNWQRDKAKKAFQTMYGKDARFVNVEAVPEIARTLNELFLDKNA